MVKENIDTWKNNEWGSLCILYRLNEIFMQDKTTNLVRRNKNSIQSI